MDTVIDASFFDPRSQRFIDDPYPFYAALRRDDPVHRSANGFWMLTRYGDIRQALREPALSSEPSHFAVVHPRNRSRYVAADVAFNVVNFMDPPRHTRCRKAIVQAFRERLDLFSVDLTEVAGEHLDRYRTAGRIDLVSEFGTPFSLSVICRFVGFPEGDIALLKSWSDRFFYLFNTIPSREVLDQVNRDLVAFREYVRSILVQRRTDPRDDLISRLIAAHDEEGLLDDMEIIDTAMLIFAVGVENVDSGIGNCVLTLLQHEDQLKRLVEKPDLLNNAIDECLRYEPLSQFVPRVAKSDVDINGSKIRKHEVVLLALASANRDPDVFPDPDRLDIERTNVQHMAFGRGHHSCIGAPLVIREYRAAIGTIVRNLPGLSLRNGANAWTSQMGHRWLKSLNVTFRPY